MTITPAAAGTRPLASATEVLNPTFTTSTSEITNGFQTKITMPVAPDTANITGSLSSGSPTITIAAGADRTNVLARVRLGDLVTHAEIPADTYVTAIAANGSTITMSANATGTAAGATIGVDPETVTGTVAFVKTTITMSGSQLKITPVVYALDGTKVFDAGDTGADAATINDATAVRRAGDGSYLINLDSFLTNARKAQS